MIPALRTAASGMQAQQTNIDTIANNLANVNTIGFRRSRAEFADLLYQNLRTPGSQSSASTRVPAGIQIGLGTRLTAVQKLFTQGSLRTTNNPLDLAIQGSGFFQVLLPNGLTAYTRAGNFTANENGQLVTPDGYLLQPQITIPAEAESVTIEADGTVSALQQGQTTTLGNIQIATFINPAGLQSRGSNLFVETTASGAPNVGSPGTNQFGTILQNYQESSNVNMVEEMVDMIIAQRAYEASSKAINVSDQMLTTAANLSR
jgi:flagellar basal-body rod protein FlgG